MHGGLIKNGHRQGKNVTPQCIDCNHDVEKKKRSRIWQESGMTEYEQEKVLDQLEAPKPRQPIPDREEDDQPRLQKIVFHEISDLQAE